jgi:peptide/nickel transport system substrate-binding protein
MKTKISLLFSIFVILSMVLTACGAPATATEPPPGATEPPAAATEPPAATEPGAATEAPTTMTYTEAPSLEGQGLPPVEERLPDQPVVTEVVDAIGKYGGTIHTASWWPEVGNVQLYFAVEAPIKWKADLTGYEPALVESYEWSEDGMTFTLHMRPGLKWSDGEPYTSADWQYWWEDFAQNTDQKIWTIPAYLRNNDGTPIAMEFPDEYTVVWKSSDRPLWIDPYFMAQGFWEFAKNFMKPKHYLEQYHPEITPAQPGKTTQTSTSGGRPLVIRVSLPGVSPSCLRMASSIPSRAILTTGAWTPKATNCPTSTRSRSRSSPTSRPAS